MKNKAPLTMIEQVIMLLVFALAAALCLQAFTAANQSSKAYAARDRAATQAQSTAEALKHTGGDYEEAAQLMGGFLRDGSLTVCYDENWQLSDAPEITYVVTAPPADASQPFLAQTTVTVYDDAEQETLFSLPVSWQTGGER